VGASARIETPTKPASRTSNYLAVEVFRTRLQLRLYKAHVRAVGTSRLWQIGNKHPLAHPVIGRSTRAGSLEITALGREIRRRGALSLRAR